jgi:DNA-directed RNA polymerase specialized sigma24 family protein
LSNAEAAQVLGIPETTVRTRVFRARQILREKMSAVMQSRPEPLKRKIDLDHGGES